MTPVERRRIAQKARTRADLAWAVADKLARNPRLRRKVAAAAAALGYQRAMHRGFDGHTNGALDREPCGAPASVKIGGRWFCEDHADSVEAYNGLTEALRETEKDEENR